MSSWSSKASALATALKYALKGRMHIGGKSIKKYGKYKPTVKKWAVQRTVHKKRNYGARPEGGNLYFKHGRPYKISSKFVSKVKEAASNINTYVFKGADTASAGYNQASYWGSSSLYNFNDIATIASVINNTQPQINTLKYIVRNAETTLTIGNQSNDTAYCQLYECQARHDLPYTVPYSSYITRLRDGFAAAGQINGDTDLSVTPFQSPAFTEAFKILNTKNFTLSPGENKKITIKDNKAFNVNMARWQVTNGVTVSPQVSGIASRTKFVLVKFWGQVLNDSTTLTSVGTNTLKLDFIYTSKYNYSFTVDEDTDLILSGTCINPDGAQHPIGGVALGQFIDEETGAVSTSTNA